MQIRIDVHHYVHADGNAEVVGLLHQVLQKLGVLKMTVQDDFAALQAKVANETTVEASAITLLQGLKSQLDALAAAGTPVTSDQINALSQQIDTNSSTLAAAVTANTPAAQPTA